MSLALRQSLTAAVLGISVFLVVIRLARRGQLSFRYSVGWLVVASTGILAGVFVPLVEPIAKGLGLSAAALIGLAALIFITVIAIQLSISISGLQRQVQVLAEQIARIQQHRESGS